MTGADGRDTRRGFAAAAAVVAVAGWMYGVCGDWCVCVCDVWTSLEVMHMCTQADDVSKHDATSDPLQQGTGTTAEMTLA